MPDKKRGDLTVTVNYIKIAQDIEAAEHFLAKLKKHLDEAAIQQGAKYE